MIKSFFGEYRFLSNFYPAKVKLDSIEYSTVEHAYQAAKVEPKRRYEILKCKTPGEAKRLGRKIGVFSYNDQTKLQIMEELIRQKFSKEPLRSMLLATGNQELVEGNNWGDVFGGKVNGVGENHLGEILMKIRKEVT